MRATVPLPARSTKNSFSTSAASSAPPQSHSQRRALRVATNITASAVSAHSTEMLPWNTGERCSACTLNPTPPR